MGLIQRSLPAVGKSEIWSQLYAWISKVKDFSNRSTYGKLERDNMYRTFGLKMMKLDDINEYLIITWNEIPNANSGIAYVDSSASTDGEISINKSPLKKGAIPGYPSYFWVIPDKNIIASLRIQDSYSLIGTQNFQYFMKSFLEKFSEPVEPKRNEHGDVSVIYKINGEETNCTAKFNLILKREPADTDELVKKYASVRKIIKKSSITHKSAQNTDAFSKFVKWVSSAIAGEDQLSSNDVTSWHFDFGYTPKSEAEFRSIIEQYLDEADETDCVDMNLGVEFEGKRGSPVWLADNVLKLSDIECTPEYSSDDELILEYEWLKRFIRENRNSLFKKFG